MQCHSLLYIHLLVSPILTIIFRKNLYVKFTITFIDFRDGIGTSTISIPNMGYPQNPPPMETQYQMSEINCEEANLVDEKGKKSISSESHLEAIHDDIMNPKYWIDISALFDEVDNNLHDKLPYDVSDALDTCMTIQSNLPPLPPPMETQYQMPELNCEEANLVDDKGKKPISSESDVEANQDDMMNLKYPDDMINTLFDEVDNNLHDKLPYNVSDDALDTCMTIQSDMPPLPPPMETQNQMSEINSWRKAIALEEGVDESQVIWFEAPLYNYLV